MADSSLLIQMTLNQHSAEYCYFTGRIDAILRFKLSMHFTSRVRRRQWTSCSLLSFEQNTVNTRKQFASDIERVGSASKTQKFTLNMSV